MNELRKKIMSLDVVLTLKFILVGIVGFIVNYIVLRISVNHYGLNKLVGEIVGTIFALQVTFLLHSYWTYSRKSLHINDYSLGAFQRYVTFITSNTVGSVMTIIAFGFTSIWIDSKMIALGLAAILGTTWNYFANLLITWRTKTSPEHGDT